MSFGAQLKLARQAAGITQKELAEKMGVSISISGLLKLPQNCAE